MCLLAICASLEKWLSFFLKKINLFLAALGLCCCTRAFLQWRAGATLHCGAQASHCGGFSCCGAWSLGARASVVVVHGLSSCGSRALERRLSSCGTRDQLPRSIQDLPRPGIKPVSPALAGGFLTTVPPGKSLRFISECQTRAHLGPQKRYHPLPAPPYPGNIIPSRQFHAKGNCLEKASWLPRHDPIRW